MSFNDDEISVESGAPREMYLAAHGTKTYPIATGQRDIEYGGYTFVAQPSARLDIGVDSMSASIQFTLVLPASHALVGRWLASLTPPQKITVVAYRKQLVSGEVEENWSGEITSMAIEGNEAKFLIPSRAQRSAQRRVPSVLTDSKCGVVLYSAWCGVDRASNTFAAHIVGVDGRNVRVAFDVAYPSTAGWAERGQFVHLPSDEPMMIMSQSAGFLDLVLQAPIYGMSNGDQVTVSRGCDHSIAMCKAPFGNVVNYVGMPARPTSNPFFPTGLGVGEVRR